VIAPAPAKINLALVVGPLRDDGKHEVATVYQRVDLGDRITVEPAQSTSVTGFDDTIVTRALAHLPGAWRVRIEKHVPVAAGLGGGSSDAATALRLANEQLDAPVELDPIAAKVGADVAFFLRDGPQLGTGDGSTLEPLDLPQDFAVVLLLPHGAEERAATLKAALAAVRRPRDLAALPANDLASSPLGGRVHDEGAFRADVSGAGPVVYGLFTRIGDAERAARRLRPLGRVWITVPAWYG
jgi:4-diphosphocytidyl-2-C-methyl-D-erythritol kinase